jgi:HEAT repeat protein
MLDLFRREVSIRSSMNMSLTLPRILAIVLLVCCRLAAPLPAFASQANAPQQPGTPTGQPDATKPAQPAPANPPAETKPALAKTRKTPKEEAWQIIEDACSGDKTADRATAILVLGLIPNDVKSVRLAESALKDEKPEVRAAAAAALGDMTSRASIPKLKTATEDQDPSVALAAAHSLDLMHDSSAYDVYYEVLNGERKTGKGLIASQTSILHDPKKMAELGFEQGIGFVPFAGIGWGAIKALRKDDASPVRAAAAKVLARDPDPAATKALADATGDNSWIVQVAALEALAKRGDPSALPTVEQYMTDEKSAIKLTAAAAVIHLSAAKVPKKRKRPGVLERKQP